MARNLNGTNQRLTSTTSITTGLPRTFGLWFYPTSTTNAGTMFFIQNSGNNFEILYWDGSNNTVILGFNGNPTTEVLINCTPSSATLNAWNQVTVVEASIASRVVYLNGVNVGSSTTSKDNGSIFLTLCLGANNLGTPSQFYAGRLADVFITNGSLSASQAAALAKGANPVPMMSTIGYIYFPLWGVGGSSGNETSLSSSAYVLSPTNSPGVADHAPVGRYAPVMPYVKRKSTFVPAVSGLYVPQRTLRGVGI